MKNNNTTNESATAGQKLKNALSKVGGTEKFNYCEPYSYFNYTDGVKDFLNKADAYWFLSILANEFYYKLGDEFYIIELKVNEDGSTEITAKHNTDSKSPLTCKISYTDTPYQEEPYKFYLLHHKSVNLAILLLSSEY